jgi:hypothetical protein
VGADTIISTKANNTGDNGKSEGIDRLWQIESDIEMKFKETSRNF